MGSGYQATDRAVIDYQLYDLPSVHRELRGPKPLDAGHREYLACAGAAQTFGRFVPTPYPALVGETLGVPVFNLGFAGAGPTYFLKHRQLIDFMNGAKACVIQVTSGRSVSNSLLEINGKGGKATFRDEPGKRMLAQEAYQRLLRAYDLQRVREVVEETQRNWVEQMTALLQAITCPTTLLWFSTRSPDYEICYDSVAGLFGEFPQLVTTTMVNTVALHADQYVEVKTNRGLPQPLFNLKTGEPEVVFPKDRFPDRPDRLRSMNNYYPSPEMHVDAATALTSALRS